jgi:choline dehydrogenase-like flavoprotein
MKRTAKPETPDVLIIGAGASGGVVARHLAEAGVKVVCLEQGHWVDEADLPGNTPEYELLGSKRWHPNPNVRANPEDYPCNCSDADLPVQMYAGVGGTSVLYGGVWSRLAPSDFRVRTLDGVADDWPLTYEELVPYFEETEWEVGLSGTPGNPAYPAGYDPPLPAHPINKAGRIAAIGMNKLGWHWWPVYQGIPSRDHGAQAKCVRYGVCMLGCPEHSKASTDVTHWPAAIKYGARLVTGARVSQITLDQQGLASGAIYLDRDGHEQFQPARVVVVAANGVGTPRLLLLSASNRFPDGLANSSGLVGRRLMLHPVMKVVGQYEERVDEWVGLAGGDIESMQFYETDTSRDFVRGSKWLLQGSRGPLDTLELWTSGEGRKEEVWGESFTTKMTSSIGHQMTWVIMPEDLPEVSNHVTLDPVLKDSDGIPAPKITYRYSENTRHILEFNIARAREAHEAAGARKTWVVGLDAESGHGAMGQAHLLGTARMGDDPASSVVDRYGRAHDVPNLYIVDGSVFVTSSGVNPTGTICALAKRTAAHLCWEARLQKVPA